MKTNSQIIRKAALELNAVDSDNVVKIAGIAKTIVNWVKGFGNPEFQQKLKELQEISPEIKDLVDNLSISIDKLNKSLSNTDPEAFGEALEDVKPMASELAAKLDKVENKAEEVKSEAPVEGIVTDTGVYMKNSDIAALPTSEKMKLLPEDLDVPLSSSVNKDVKSFNWFNRLSPDDIRISASAQDWVLEPIVNSINDRVGDDLSMEQSTKMIRELYQMKPALMRVLKNKILNGTLRKYQFKNSPKDPLRMRVVIDAGTINIPGIGDVLYPAVILDDLGTSTIRQDALDLNMVSGVRVASEKTDVESDYTEDFIRSTLDSKNWNIAATARELGMNERSLRRLMKKLNIERPVEEVEQEQVVEEPVTEEFVQEPESEPEQEIINEEEQSVSDGTFASRLDALKKLAEISSDPKFTEVASIKGLENKSPEFISELINVGNRLGIDPSFMASVMRSESGFNHQAINPRGGATGLIQFMPATAKKLGTSTEDLAAMSDVEQLAYVEKFFKPWAGRIKSPGDLYMATFLPIFVGKPSDTIIGQKDNKDVIAGNLTYHKVWDYNKVFDKDKDGIIRVSDVTGRANSIYNAGVKRGALTPSSVSQPVQKEKEMSTSPTSPEVNPSQYTGQDARELFNFLYASGPIEKIVKRALYEKYLPKNRLLISIGSKDIEFHNRVRFAKVLSSALRIELDAECSMHNYNDKIEIEADVYGPKGAVMKAANAIYEGLSDTFEDTTSKRVTASVVMGVKSSYGLIESSVMEDSFRKFAFEQGSRGVK